MSLGSKSRCRTKKVFNVNRYVVRITIRWLVREFYDLSAAWITYFDQSPDPVCSLRYLLIRECQSTWTVWVKLLQLTRNTLYNPSGNTHIALST